MATDVTMPRLSDSMEEGTILKWLVSEGDEVEKGPSGKGGRGAAAQVYGLQREFQRRAPDL